MIDLVQQLQDVAEVGQIDTRSATSAYNPARFDRDQVNAHVRGLH